MERFQNKSKKKKIDWVGGCVLKKEIVLFLIFYFQWIEEKNKKIYTF